MGAVKVQGRRFELASLWERLAGQFLDGLIYAAFFVIGLLAGLPFDLVILTILGVIAAILYELFRDGLTNGQSLGKRVVKTRVIDSRTAGPCTFGQSFLRNFLLDVLGLIDWVFIFGEKRQRLGDRAAHTYVVKLRELPKMSPEELAGE